MMMTLAKLKSIVKRGESDALEFKASTKQLERGMETLCAFLNSKDGGTLLFGVKDKTGEIVGQSDTDEIRQTIANHLNHIEPFPEIETISIPVNKTDYVIALIVKHNSNAPYVCKGRPYQRVQS